MEVSWIVPCNCHFFNIIEYLDIHNEVVWKKSRSIKCGDIAYIYVGNPYGEVLFKCKVEKDSVDEKTMQENQYAIRGGYNKSNDYMILSVISRYPEGTFKLNKLRLYGLGQVQRQTKVTERMERLFNSFSQLKGEKI